MDTFNMELEIVNPFPKYQNVAKNAPKILKEECLKIIKTSY